MALSVRKALLIIAAAINLGIIAKFAMLGKSKIAWALSILELAIVFTAPMVE